MTRTNPASSAHKKGVRREVQRLERQNWNVRADLPGDQYPEPEARGKHIPDIVATKQGHTRIVEVETGVDQGGDQHRSFKLSAAQSGRNTIFYWMVVDRYGRPEEVFGNVPRDFQG